MRAHDSDQGYQSDLRPKASRVEEPESALALKAALSGRLDAAGPAGVMGLQRAVGNAGTAAVIDEERRRSMTWSRRWQPLPGTYAPTWRLGWATTSATCGCTTTRAEESAKAVNAHAYTVGPNIVFQRDRYDPSSDAGRVTLAHELTHVIQQRSGPVDGSAPGDIRISDPSDRFEREAAANASG